MSFEVKYPRELRYLTIIHEAFDKEHPQQGVDLAQLYTMMHLIDDIVDNKTMNPRLRLKRAQEALEETLKSPPFQSLKERYGVREQDLRSLTAVLMEVLGWPECTSPFRTYAELESYNRRLMHTVACCVVPVVFAEAMQRDPALREELEAEFTNFMMAMQIVNLVVDFEEDVANHQHYFPSIMLEEPTGSLAISTISMLKAEGTKYLNFSVPFLTHVNIVGESAATFVRGLDNIYEKLFARV